MKKQRYLISGSSIQNAMRVKFCSMKKSNVALLKCNRPEIGNFDHYPVKNDSEAIRIISANILYKNALIPQKAYKKKFSWEYRAEKIGHIFAYYYPDIVGLQEPDKSQAYDVPYKMNEILGKIQYKIAGFSTNNPQEEPVHTAKKFHTNEEYISIVYNAERFELVDQDYFCLSEHSDAPEEKKFPKPGFGGVYPRIAAWFVLREKISKKEFFVVNTHFDHNSQPGCKVRYRSAQLLRKKVKELTANKSYTVIVMADFNLFPNSEERIFDGNDAYLELCRIGHDIRDLSQTPHIGPDGTYPGYPGDKYYAGLGKSGCRLDQIFVKHCCVIREGVLADNYDIKRKKIYCQNRTPRGFLVKPSEPLPSDHHFLIADLKPL